MPLLFQCNRYWGSYSLGDEATLLSSQGTKLVADRGSHYNLDVRVSLKGPLKAIILNDSMLADNNRAKRTGFYRYRILTFHKIASGSTELLITWHDKTLSLPLIFADSSVQTGDAYVKRRRYSTELSFLEYLFFPPVISEIPQEIFVRMLWKTTSKG